MKTLTVRACLPGLLCVLLHLCSSAYPHNNDPGSPMLNKAGSTKLFFEENKSQFRNDVLFHAESPELVANFLSAGVSFTVIQNNRHLDSLTGFSWQMIFEHGNPDAAIKAAIPVPGVKNYITENKAISGVRSYNEILYSNVYRDIDAKFYFNKENKLEYDFVLKPGAQVDAIRLKLKGIKNLSIAGNGELVLHTSLGKLYKGTPYSYQLINGKKKIVATKYRLTEDNLIGFEILEQYDTTKPLVIDPVVLQWSTFVGGNGTNNEVIKKTYFDNAGNSYVIGTFERISTADYPVSVGAFQMTHAGNKDIVITKLNASGQLVYSTYYGGNALEDIGLGGSQTHLLSALDANYLYITGSTKSPNLPVTNGTSIQPLILSNATINSVDLFYAKFNINTGLLNFATYLESGPEVASAGFLNKTQPLLIVENGNAFIAYSQQFAIGNSTMVVVTQYTAGNGLQYRTIIDGNSSDRSVDMEVDNGNVYLLGSTSSTAGIATAGAYATTALYGGFLAKINSAGIRESCTYLSTVDAVGIDLCKSGGNFVVLATTYTMNLATTDGSTSAVTSESDLYLISFTSNLQRVYATHKVAAGLTEGYMYDGQYLSPKGNGVFVTQSDITAPFYTSPDAMFSLPNTLHGNIMYEVDQNGVVQYGSVYGNVPPSGVNSSSIIGIFTRPNEFALFNSTLIGSGIRTIPITANAAQATSNGGEDVSITIFDNSWNVQYSTYLGGTGSEVTRSGGLFMDDNYIYVTGVTTSNDFPVTADAVSPTKSASTYDQFFTIIKRCDGQIHYSTYLPGGTIPADAKLYVAGNTITIIGHTSDNDNFPTTENAFQTTRRGTSDFVFYQFRTDPEEVTPNTLFPASQTVCINGVGNTIDGNAVTYTNLPNLVRNGVVVPYPVMRAQYQWQEAPSPAGPWTNIGGATTEDFLPNTTTTTKYFRRLVINNGCTTIPVDTSNVVEVVVNTLNAPVADAGSNLYTCPGGSVTLGGSPSATGGNGTLSYEWNIGTAVPFSTGANPSVTPAANTIYTLTVTDQSGCIDKAQAVVMIHQANAGPDRYYCTGQGVQIGTPAIAGLTGATYSWSPATGLDNAAAPEPIASPAVTTNYTLTVTIPVQGGGTCTTTDATVVTPSAAPNNNINFAGPDATVCVTGTTLLGTPAAANFTYSWTPGSYLSNSNIARPTFNTGTVLPLVNPLNYSVTAIHNITGCRFEDQVAVFVNRADAGVDRCGPSRIGSPDHSNGQATYVWTVLSGTATLSNNNIAQPQAFPNGTGVSTIQVAVTWNGVTCTDVMQLNPGGMDCTCAVLDIITEAIEECPKSFNGNPFWIRASGVDTADWNFTWSPSAGLSTTTGYRTQVTTTSPATYTLTAVNKWTGAVACSKTMTVNDPSWALPLYNAPDVTACPGVNTTIGLPASAGFGYTWSNGPTTAQQVVNHSYSTQYSVRVRDLASGCSISDVVNFVVSPVVVNAGRDWTACNGAVVTLGAPSTPNHTYSWSPSAGLSDPTSSNPTITVFSSQIFTVTATNTLTGCSSSDAAQVTINNNPTIANAPNVTICNGGGVMIGSPALPGVTYSWSPATGLSDPNIAQPFASPTSTTTYTCTAVFPGGCASNPTDAVTVTVSAPAAFSLGADIVYCPSTPVTLTGPAGGGYTYRWSPSYGLSSTTTQSTIATPLVPTTYTLTVTSAGCTRTDAILVTPGSLANAGIDRRVCPGESATLGSSANAGTISWAAITGGAPTLSATNVSEPSINTTSGTSPGNYTYRVTITNGGCTATDDVIITVSNPGTANAGADHTICAGACVTIGSAAVAGKTYSWFPTTGLNNANIAQPVACPSATTVYTLSVTDAVTGCTVSDAVTVMVNNAASPTLTGGTTTSCPAMAVMLPLTVSPAGSYQYVWSPAVELNDPFVSNPVSYPTTSRTYNVTVNSLSNFCSNIATSTVNVSMSLCLLLDVNFLSFTGANNKNENILKWKASGETDLKEYVVERSESSSFTQIGSVPVNSGGSINDYQFTDKQIFQGKTYYYRIKGVGIDGKYSYSNIVQVGTNKKQTFDVLLYPNPATTMLHIRASDGSIAGNTFTVYNLDGKELRRGKIQSNSTLDISNLINGYYFIRIMNGKEVVMKSFLIAR